MLVTYGLKEEELAHIPEGDQEMRQDSEGQREEREGQEV